MSGRIVVFGATGYTGRLTVRALVEQGARPVLAGRDRAALEALATDLGPDVEVAQADIADPPTVHALVERGDVLVSTVGPFMRYGTAALTAAVDKGAIYLDSSGEPPFIQEVFETYGPRAEQTGATLVTAFGYDFVPGNLAGALALDQAGHQATKVEIGYFVNGRDLAGAVSAGTLESLAEVAGAPMYTYRKGIVPERRCQVKEFDVGGTARPGMSIGASEHYTLPRSYPELQEVEVYLGWLGRATRLMAKLPRGPVTGAVGKAGLLALARVARRRGGRATVTARVVAVASDSTGVPLAEVHLSGVDPYDFTARIIAWGAIQAIHGLSVKGAVGPVEAFGLADLEVGSAISGIARVAG